MIRPLEPFIGDFKFSFPLKQRLDDTFRPSSRHPDHIGGIVIHTAECGESPTAAEALASWAAGVGGPRASWHFAVDNNSVVQSVLCRNVAWHAGGVNHWTIGIELAGKAGQTPEQWRDDYSKAVIRNAAELCARLADVCGLPIVRASQDDIAEANTFSKTSRAALKIGFFGHVDANRALGVKGHWDPGPNFPWEDFLSFVRGERVEIGESEP